MASFSLSPYVKSIEQNLTGYVPTLPSAKTGMILRADQGPCLDITSVTKEENLISQFGKPTAANFQDWFAAWNFLQYASSLYVVRPMNTDTKNAGISISANGSASDSRSNFYNSAVAHKSLEDMTGLSDPLYFINKEVTSTQKLAVAVCSGPDSFKKQLGLEYFAIANTVDGTSTVTSTGTTPTLTNGSQVVLNGSKLATVVSVVQSNSTSGSVVFDRAVSAVDVAPFYGVVSASAASVTGIPANGTVTVSVKKDGFTFKVGSVYSTNFVVSNITNGDINTDFAVTFKNKSVTGQDFPALSVDQVIYSETVFYSGTTAYNPETGNFGCAIGATSLLLQPGFILEAGVEFTIDGKPATVASIDTTLNKIFLTSAITAAVSGATTLALVPTIVQPNKVLIGVNYFDKVYDSSLIKKTRKVVTNAAGELVTIIAQSLVPFSAFFDFPPNWTNDEFVVVVLKKNDDGYYEKADSKIVSYNPLAKNSSGANIFVENVFTKASPYLYAKVGSTTEVRPSTSELALPKLQSATGTVYPLKGGSSWDSASYDATQYTQGDIMEAYSLFAEPEQFDINLITSHEADANYASIIAESRKDCLAVVVPYDYAFLANNSNNDCASYLTDNYGTQTDYDQKVFGSFGTYTSIYGNMKYQYDKWNNVNRWINLAGDIAGLFAQNDSNNDPWWAVAGTTRGIIKNCIKLAFNPSKQNRDDLYVNGINPVMAIEGQGQGVVMGQKTATATPSAMDRVNVRRLLIHVEKSIAIASNIGLFEFNDAFTRNRLYNIIDPFLRSIKSRRGLYNYGIVIDESNNGAEVIDQNGLNIAIFLQPTKVAEFINVTANIIPTGASFSEFVTTGQ